MRDFFNSVAERIQAMEFAILTWGYYTEEGKIGIKKNWLRVIINFASIVLGSLLTLSALAFPAYLWTLNAPMVLIGETFFTIALTAWVCFQFPKMWDKTMMAGKMVWAIVTKKIDWPALVEDRQKGTVA